MAKTYYSVVRNAGNMRSSFTTRERHNERKNEAYGNGDVVSERTNLNVHFRQNFRDDGTVETYEETYNRLLSEGTISEKWQKPDSKSFDEMVFDVNTDYFERMGGYDYAQRFFAEAYRCAVAEAGGEQYIISAVLHADERNAALSKELGREVFHYHLHVVYVPVVEKVEYFRKKKGDPDGERKVKAVYAQVSHSKKWPLKVEAERGGKTVMLNSYSLLQDRFHDHMKAAGFDGFERGERGSTAEHLDVLDYKIQQDEKRLDTLDSRIDKKQERIAKLDDKIAVREKAKATIDEVAAMGKPTLLGGVNFTADEAKKLKALAKKSVAVESIIAADKKKMEALDGQISDLKAKLRDAQAEVGHWHREYMELWNEVKDFIGAIRKFPARLRDFIAGLFKPEHSQEQKREQQRIMQHPQKKAHFQEAR